MSTLPLSDEQLVERLHDRVGVERRCIADVIEDLAELDVRQIYVGAGCSSLTRYCVEELGYSEDDAYSRVAVARLARRCPCVLDMLRDGRLSLSALRLLERHITRENAAERLTRAAGLTVKKIEVLIASWAPKPDVPTTVRVIAEADAMRLLERIEPSTAAPVTHPTEIAAAECAPASPTDRPAPLPKPLSPGKRAITFTLDEGEYLELMRLRDLDRHSIPDGDIKKIIVAAVRDRLARVEARKLGKLKRPRAEQPASAIVATRQPTQAQKREVAARDGEQCSYVSPAGKRCTSTAWLEHDHIDGWALTHETSAPRLQLLCRTHNRAKGSAPKGAHVM